MRKIVIMTQQVVVEVVVVSIDGDGEGSCEGRTTGVHWVQYLRSFCINCMKVVAIDRYATGICFSTVQGQDRSSDGQYS